MSGVVPYGGRQIVEQGAFIPETFAATLGASGADPDQIRLDRWEGALDKRRCICRRTV